MGANPYNTNLELRGATSSINGNSNRINQLPADYAPGREALQALLAFSSLHEQIRRRDARRWRALGLSPAERWAADDFVLDEVLQLVAERALMVTGADGVALALSDGEHVVCRSAAGQLTPPAGSRLNPNSGFSGACFRTGLIIRCDDSFRDPRVDREACHRMGVRAMVAVPLITDQGVIGLLEGFSSEPYGFNDSDVRSLSLLAELVLSALKPERPVEVQVEEEPEASPVDHAVDQTEEPLFAQHLFETAPQAAPPLVEEHFAAPIQSSAVDNLPTFDSVRSALTSVIEDNGHVRPQEFSKNEISADVQQKAQKEVWAEEDEPLFAQVQKPDEAATDSRRRIIFIGAGLLLLLALVAVAWWWSHDSHTPAAAAKSASPAIAAPAPVEPEIPAPAATESKDSALPAITGVRHWSSDDTSTVAIDLQEQVQYEAHRLTDPERIYFDLHDTSIAPGVTGTIEVGDNLLVRIRVAQPAQGVTRVVMETKNSPNFSVSLEPHPYRLLVQIRSITAKTKKAENINLFAPMHRELPGEVAVNHRAAERELGAWLAPPADNAPSPHSAKFRVVLDAGHGGWDMGTVGRKGLAEKNLVLDIVARLGNLVEKRLGGEVLYTRHDDTYVALESRTEIANRAQADFFLSVHANYSDLASARGVETYYTNTFSEARSRPVGLQEASATVPNVNIREKTDESKHFASMVQKELYHALAGKDRSLRNRGVREASYVVLTGTTMPAVLAEVSFVSSPADEMSLQSAAYRQRIAEALYRGVASYASSLHHMNLASAAPASAGN